MAEPDNGYASPEHQNHLADQEPQANIAIAGKYEKAPHEGKPRTRDWQLYFFFRFLTEKEAHVALNAMLKAAIDHDDGKTRSDNLRALEDELNNPGAFSLEKDATSEKAQQKSAHQKLAGSAFAWLDMISSGATRALTNQEAYRFLMNYAASNGSGNIVPQARGGRESSIEEGQNNTTRRPPDENVFSRMQKDFLEFGEAVPTHDRPTAGEATADLGRNIIKTGLSAIALHEVFRQLWLANSANNTGLVRSAKTDFDPQTVQAERAQQKPPFDKASINIAFTHQGLNRLGLNETVLRSFPEAFRDGMAARAERLGDTGANAPEHWYGELGSKRIDGYFTGGFLADDVEEAAWTRVRKEIDSFNRRNDESRRLREELRIFFLPFGIDVLHIELGQAPYAIEDGVAKPIWPRKEHFGFRDGISQPFVDMSIDAHGNMKPPKPGGATPRRNRTWAPAAPGEIYLGQPDEDGHKALRPANKTLRDGGTYIVFRKLAQDVVGFRNFLKSQRPDNEQAQEKLAAEIVGRWKSGASLVDAPDAEIKLDEEQINDFRFAADDPDGQKCPLSAHIRRTNPRDIGGRGEARRHRLMRRSMAYGGALMDEKTQDDGVERGLLFVAANARIEMQFEVMQGDWINGGEFLGQTGLNKCPLIGTNDARLEDAFLEAGAASPITHLPRFVTMRGGDYFFAPSIAALRRIAQGHAFEPSEDDLTDNGHSFGDGATEDLFGEKRIAAFTRKIAFGGANAIGVRLPEAKNSGRFSTETDVFEDALAGKDVIFVGKYDDVSAVLNSRPDKNNTLYYTAARSRRTGNAMLRCGNLLVGTDYGHETEKERKILRYILDAAWSHGSVNWRARLEAATKASLRRTVFRIALAGHADLVRDFAADAVYDVVSALFGTPGPDHLTELAFALPFSRAHVGEIDPGWLSALRGESEENPGLVTFKIWSFLIGVNLVGDLTLQKKARQFGVQAAGEMMLHLDMLIDNARTRRNGNTLLNAFVSIETDMRRQFGLDEKDYYGFVRALLLELSLTASAIVPAVYGSLIDAIFEFNLDLNYLFQTMFNEASDPTHANEMLTRFIYELNRLRPALPITMRLCEAAPIGEAEPPPLPSTAQIRVNQWVAALVIAANLDKDKFPDPLTFSFGQRGQPPRPLQNYLMFGVNEDNPATRICWGRDTIALYMLREMLRSTAALPGMRRVAGPAGELKKMFGVTEGLKVKFAPFTPR